MWFDALSCDGTHTLTTAVYSDDFNCDAASECDYVGIEYYPLDPNDPCTDDVAPTDVTPGYIPFVVDPCFSTSYWNEYIFVSDCDACIGAMMSVFIDHDQPKDALQLYDECTLINKFDICHLAIKACVNDYNYSKGQHIIDGIPSHYISRSPHGLDIMNTYIAFYGHVGEIDGALNIFNSISDDKKDIVTINAMMTVCVNNEYYDEALRLYDTITLHSDSKWIANDMTHCLAIKLCACIHEDNIQIQNTLIDFYGHCGDLSNAFKIFDSISDHKKDVVSVNAMMSAYISNGEGMKANQLFNDMKFKADCKTYSILLNGCSHSGDVDHAMHIWMHDIKHDNIKYNHYVITCMVDCYARKGYLK
eukprot:801758_1